MISTLPDSINWNELPSCRRFNKKPNLQMLQDNYSIPEIVNGQPVSVIYDSNYVKEWIKYQFKYFSLKSSQVDKIAETLLKDE